MSVEYVAKLSPPSEVRNKRIEADEFLNQCIVRWQPDLESKLRARMPKIALQHIRVNSGSKFAPIEPFRFLTLSGPQTMAKRTMAST
jgi:hypothetical protein